MEERKVENSQSIYCTNCGKEINEAAEICTSCGVRQGKIINHCYSCGNEIGPNQELCLQCGVNPRKLKRPSIMAKETTASGAVNVTVATIVGALIPGLPPILWYGQKTKGIALIIAPIICGFLLPVISNIAFSIFGAVDAHQLGKRINQGESLEEWTFFWNK